jgi:hypothetical protein
MKDKAIPMTLGKRRLLAALAVWLLVPSAETITGVVLAADHAISSKASSGTGTKEKESSPPVTSP